MMVAYGETAATAVRECGLGAVVEFADRAAA